MPRIMGVEKRSGCDWCGRRKKNVDGQTVDPNNEGGHYLESKFGEVYYYIPVGSRYVHTYMQGHGAFRE